MFVPMLARAAVAAAAVLSASAATAPSAGRGDNPFAGRWAGTWSIEGLAGGTTTLEITPSGRTTGTYQNLVFGVTGTIKGHVGADGSFTLIGFRDDLPNG